ncbi:RHS repeat-associated core domain-containing protein [Actinomycetes bacterium KLBMP 9797]
MSSRWRAGIAGGVAVVMAGSLLVATPAAAKPAPPWRAPAAQTEKSVPVRNFVPRAQRAPKAAAAKPATVAWPAAGEADVTWGRARAKAGKLPVAVGAAKAGQAKVRVLDRAAADRVGVAGLLFTVGTADRRGVHVEVDYSSFRHAYGGDWASRLRLVELPACALSTPERAECRTGKPLPTTNRAETGTLTADVTVGTATVLAAAAAPSGSAGSYTATPLSASSSWEVGGAAGDFGWSYQLDSPPGFGGPEPDLDVKYNSSGVDGRTAATNNQTSWVGDGWDLSEGFVERRYKSCSDEVTTTPKPYDLCWETDNAFVSLGDKTVELVKDDTTGAWRPRNDDGTKVERLTGATNGDNDGEHWKVTDREGTQYFFGLNRLPGWATGNEVTNSTLTSPVFGNDSGEPCHASTFAASHCTQAYRWNLDYVVDSNGNAMSYFYTRNTNYYGRNRTASAGTAYHRDSYLSRIDYGQRSDTLYSASAPMRVVFTTEERCAAGATCGTETITKDTAKNWPDVPYDQNCNSGATCTDLFAPTFWSRKRLKTVTTKVLVSGTTYKDVDAYTFGYQFREPGDGTSPVLWLSSIARSGKVGGTLALPVVTFEGTQLENRVDAEEGIPPMYRWRLTDVYDEFGGHVRVNYSGKDCTRATVPAPDSNTTRCFPQYWTPEGETTPKLDWFHKYVAVQVLQDDQAGVAGIEQTDYAYSGGGAWHYDDNELTPAKYRTWSEWRGYARVKVTKGAPGDVRSQSETLYYRGMDGDKKSSGTRSATVTDSEGVAVADHPALSGGVRETITYNGPGGAVLDGEIRDYWVSAATSTRGSTKAYLTGVSKERTRLALAAGGWQRTETQTSYDAYGLPTQVNDLGDTSTSGDDECVRITYATRDTTKWLIDFKAREENVSVACTATPSRPTDVLSDVRTFYDGSTTLAATPTKGDVTLTQEVASYSGSTPTYVQSTRATYDVYGRTLDSYDALDRKTSTRYTPATGGPLTSSTVTNHLGHVSTSTYEPAWGDETSLVDANGRRTDLTYDPLGQLTAAWLPDRSKADGETPSQKFSYLIRTDAPNVVTTEAVRDDGAYDAAYGFFDGRLRPRQTQKPVPDGGRIVTDTFYDSRGLKSKSNGAYWNDGTAGTTLATVADNTVPAQTVTVYDGVERGTTEIFRSYGTEKWRTLTTYGGDRVSVTPPAGGTATTTISDANGKTVELRQHTGGTPSSGYDATKYTYTRSGDLATVTDAAGNVWKYTYDLRGRKVKDEDPDKGATAYTYDNADQVLTATDARGKTLALTYDGLGRKTATYEGSTSGTKLSEWTYDTLMKGQPTSSIRYVNGNAYTTATTGYDLRYRSLGTAVTIPAAEGALAGTYRANTGYTDTGLPLLRTYPAAGGLAAETLRYSYDGSGRLVTGQTGLSTLLTAASYTPYGEPAQYTLQGVAGKQLVQTFMYDDATRKLSRSLVDRNVSPTRLADVNYTYDAAGNVTKIADGADTQCFTYDYVRRLTSAWTANNNCATAPSLSVLGGPAPYWQAWTYDKIGNRLTETNHSTATGAGTTSSYAYPAAGAARPHALASVTTNGQTTSYGYDETGNTTARPGQTLTWDIEGHLATVTENGKTSEFLYDAEGDRLIRRDADAVTLYLGGTELELTRATGAVAATRYYELGGVTAVRSASGGLSFAAKDRLGTAQISVDADDLAVTQRRYLPFGELRGAAPASWPDERGYVGGTMDGTGLTHLGAREYDPDTGRFISVDPIIDSSDPQQMNAYAYSNNTPVTMSDPDGRWALLPGGHYCDGCSGNKVHKPSKPKKKKAKKKKSYSGHFCDGCEYGGSGDHHYHPPRKKVYPGDLRQHDNKIAAEARRLAREYAARKAREEAAKKAKLAAQKAKREVWMRCMYRYAAYTSKCGEDPMPPKKGEGVYSKVSRHVFASWQVCPSHACFKFKVQNGRISILTAATTSPAKPGWGSLFPTVGWANKTSDREKSSVSGSFGRYGVGVGVRKNGTPNGSDWDASVGTNPAGGWLGTENSGIQRFGLSGTTTLGSWCVIGNCR